VGQPQLGGGLREAQVPRRGIEGWEGGERRKLPGHV
jgi:hypothetical protein